MKKFKLVIVFFILLFNRPLFSQNIEEVYSPGVFSSGRNAASFDSPVGDILNPAASGIRQRVTLECNYAQLAGFGSEPGLGSVVNLGITLPSPAGVFSTSGHFRNAVYPGINWGTLGGVNFSFAKDLFPYFLGGVGIKFLTGVQNNTPDWALGADIGFIHIMNNVWIFKDFRWGFTLRDLGKWYAPTRGTGYFPEPFTPSVGANFKLLKTEEVMFTLMPDLSFPAFSNLKFNLGTEFALFDFFTLSGRYTFNLNDTVSGITPGTTPFALGIALKFKTDIKEKIAFLDISERGWHRSEIKTSLAVMPLKNDIWVMSGGVNLALGVMDTNPPVITLNLPEESYISPNFDGNKDYILIPLSIRDERYVKGYSLVIMNEQQQAVKTIRQKDERPETFNLKNLAERITYRKSAVTIPDSLVWNGQADDSTACADGIYYIQLEAWDDNANREKSDLKKVIVDTTLPGVEISAPYMVFSPDNDGRKDTLQIMQSGTKEDLWQGEITDKEGNAITTNQWIDGAPALFEWQGLDSTGKTVPDGVYNYKIYSADRAGNKTLVRLDNIIVNTRQPQVSISINQSDFSPDNNKIQDTLEISFEAGNREAVEKWNLAVLNNKGNPVRKYRGVYPIPDSIAFDGKDDKDSTLGEGRYLAVLTIDYNNGYQAGAQSPEFEIDLTPPAAHIKSDYPVFSPDNDGQKDFLTINQESSLEDKWTGEIRDSSDKTVKTLTWVGNADKTLVWYGRDNKGNLLPNGKYSYYLYSTDRAGNYGMSDKITVQLEIKDTPLYVSTNLAAFSPNGDGVQDKIEITPFLKDRNGIESYLFTVKDNTGVLMYSETARNNLPEKLTWNGLKNDYSKAADGNYKAYLQVNYTNGNKPAAETQPFGIDTISPVIQASARVKLFSPDGDKLLDTIVITQKSSEEELWEAEIKNKQGKRVYSTYWRGVCSNFTWNGRDDNGNLVPDGKYDYGIYSTDKAGNYAKAEIPDIEVDTRPTAIFITVQAPGFSPNKDSFKDVISFNPVVELQEGIKEWSLEMINTGKGLQKVFSGEGKIMETVIWDGTNSAGMTAAEGAYYARFTVEYYKGNKPVRTTALFQLDITPPELKLSGDPRLFSPDNDGENDELKLMPVILDASALADWKINILEPNSFKLFKEFKGTGMPAETIRWDGLSDKNVLVEAAEDYPVEFQARDIYGNTALIKDTIPVDVLVLKEGDRLKIRIASIVFVPDTADYVNVQQDRKEKNLWVIDRLAKIFNRFRDYNIQIDGHAVSLYWADKAKAEKEDAEACIPLSTGRAEAIKEALIQFGVDRVRIEAKGKGSKFPVVPHGDLENRWKNRRVEFFLIKKK